MELLDKLEDAEEVDEDAGQQLLNLQDQGQGQQLQTAEIRSFNLV